MVEAFVGPIIEIIKFVGCPVVKYLKDQKKFHDHLEQFNESKGHLCTLRDDIKSKLDSELRRGKVARGEVQKWLNDAETSIERKEVADEVNGWGCLSCCCRVKVLEERAQELREIFERGDKYTDECLVKDDPSVSAVELPTTELQGNEVVKADILKCLTGNEVAKLGVWGMGGIGKTTIMKHVHNELLNKRKFNKVIWATVSYTLDIYKLQDQIADILNEGKNEEEKIELKKKDTTVRAGQLLEMLERHKPYLLILDDVWRSFELEDVGIPKPVVSDGCKLVLTTRSQEVARAMGCKIIKVKTLSKKEALKLFMDKVGDIVLSDEATLKGIVDECNGLPLAIVTVAGSLKGVSEPWLWRAALNQLKDYKRNVASTDDGDAFGVLKFSYDRLKTLEIQHCFLCCALYPEDHNIPISSIVDYWIDEGLIDEMGTLQAMMDEGHYLLKKLEDNCLLESIECRFEGNCVRMHDLVRDMALQITRTSPRFMVGAGKALTKLPERGRRMEDLEKVSLMRNKIEEIPSSILSSECIMLTTLLLSHNKLSTISESIFEHMPALKILDLSYNDQLRSLPSSIFKLVNLTTLLLQYCRSLTEVPSLSELGALKKLDLDRTKIKEVPKGLEMCTNLKYLSLRGFHGEEYLDRLDGAILLNLSKLQQLFVDERIALRGKVIGRLEKLEAFHGRFPTVHDWSIFWECVHDHGDHLSNYYLRVRGNPFLDRGGGDHGDHLSNYDLRARENPFLDRGGGYRMVELGGIDIAGENIILPHSVNGLVIKRCNNLRSLNDFSSIEDAKYLKSCVIEWCEGIENVFSSWINPLVQHLKELSLAGLDKLEGLFEAEAIARSPLPPGTFLSVKSIGLFNCGKIKKLITSLKLLGYLQSLEWIHVNSCKELEEIIASDPEEFEATLIAMSPPPPPGTFSSLKSIWLGNCGKIKKFISSWKLLGNLQSLEQIDVHNCEELEEIIASDPEEFEGTLIAMSPAPPPGTFSSLKSIKLFKCDKIKKLFPSRMLLGYLQSLERIDVHNCEELEEIIASNPEEGGDTIKKLILPKLKHLLLSDLPALKSICSGRAVMECDSLEEIQVSFCKELEEIIASDPEEEGEGGDIIKKHILPKLKLLLLLDLPALKSICSRRAVLECDSLEEIRVSYCEELEEIIASDPEEEGGGDIIKKLILPKLKKLSLQNLPALKSICSRSAVMGCDSLESNH